MQYPVGFVLVSWTVTLLCLADLFGADVVLDVAAVVSAVVIIVVVVLLVVCGSSRGCSRERVRDRRHTVVRAAARYRGLAGGRGDHPGDQAVESTVKKPVLARHWCERLKRLD